MIKTGSKAKILVWDVPVRVFHWLLVLSFAGAYITAESERWRQVHVTLGYTLGGLVVFRVVWGFVGTPNARFANFVRGPSEVWWYLKSMITRRPARHLGHNPVGALMVLLFLLSGALIVVTGAAIDNNIGGKGLADWHERTANFMLGLVIAHVIGVMLASSEHRENLISAMFTGKKMPRSPQVTPGVLSGFALVIVVVMFCFWYVEWQSPSSTAPVSKEAAFTQPHTAEPSD
jgi:cytochrome b